jgi:uncharacterized protein involved in response to NO
MTFYFVMAAMTYGFILGMLCGAKERPFFLGAILWGVLWPVCWVWVAVKLSKGRRA